MNATQTNTLTLIRRLRGFDGRGLTSMEAAHIVRCVNSHDALVKIVEACLRIPEYNLGKDFHQRCEAALAKANE